MEKNDIRNLMAVTNGTHIDSKILSIFINTIEKISKFSVFFKTKQEILFNKPHYYIRYAGVQDWIYAFRKLIPCGFFVPGMPYQAHCLSHYHLYYAIFSFGYNNRDGITYG